MTRLPEEVFQLSEKVWCDREILYVTTLVPIGFVDEAKIIGVEHLIETGEKVLDPALIFPCELAPTLTGETTHYGCELFIERTKADLMHDKLVRAFNEGHLFSTNRKLSLLDAPGILKNKLCVIEVRKDVLFAYVGLVEKP